MRDENIIEELDLEKIVSNFLKSLLQLKLSNMEISLEIGGRLAGQIASQIWHLRNFFYLLWDCVIKKIVIVPYCDSQAIIFYQRIVLL